MKFRDVTSEAGIRFSHNNGAFGLKFMPETMGSGVAWWDYNSDGYQDLFFVNGRDWTQAEVEAYMNGPGREHQKKHGFIAPTPKPRKRSAGALYRNNGNGTFSDVTRGSGLDVEMQGMGACVGDYDNDGRDDLYVTAVGRNYLFHNQSKREPSTSSDRQTLPEMVEVSRQAGVQDFGWSTSAAWVDYDKDGKLDLFVCHYVDWSPAKEVYHSTASRLRDPNEKIKSYAGPGPYQGEFNRLYRNVGNGKFEDVSARTGIQRATEYSGRLNRQLTDLSPSDARRLGIQTPKKEKLLAKALGVVVTDVDKDDWPDLVVANDTEPIFYYRNNRNGTFSDLAVKAGLTRSEAPSAGAGMGIDSADLDLSGWESIVVGYYADELIGLYHNVGQGAFESKAAYAELGRPGTKFVIFGSLFMDVNNDRWQDIMTVNGHVMDDIRKQRKDLNYAQPPLLFLNRKRKDVKFDNVALSAGALSQAIVGRGLACADFDLDGDLDVIITVNGGTPRLLRNDGGNKNNALRVSVSGAKSNRSGIGARVEITNDGQTLIRTVRSGSSYLSQNELPLTIGIGNMSRVDHIKITWPAGTQVVLKNVAANQMLTVDETSRLVSSKPFPKQQ